jgi:hypothetical protein
MDEIIVKLADKEDLVYVSEIKDAIFTASEKKGTGIAVRDFQYLTDKILEGKAVIAKNNNGKWAGFCYIETWGHNKFVANSGLIVAEAFRGIGLAGKIKHLAFDLSRKLYPEAKIFGITTSLAVLKINTGLGYRPVTISELTDDDDFWEECMTCPYYDVLMRTKRTHCLCTAMLYDPEEKTKKSVEQMKEPHVGHTRQDYH